MSKYTEIFNYLRQCPQLADLWSIGAAETDGAKVILPQGTSQKTSYKDFIDSIGSYNCDIIPNPSVYEDYQINAYYYLDTQSGKEPDECLNVLNIEDAQAICDWIELQNDTGNLPKITNKQVVSIEALPFNPQVRAADILNNRIAYFITVRIRYVNPAIQRSIYYEI